MTEETKQITAEELAQSCASVADDRKAENITVIKVGEVSLIADYFVICTANSQPHLSAITEWTRRKLREKYNLRPISVDGTPISQWIVMDYGNVVFHILTDEAREKYQLEDLWGDAEKIEKIFSERVSNSSS